MKSGSPLLALCHFILFLFLVKMDVGPLFCINLVHCVHMKAQQSIQSKKNFKIDFFIWPFLGSQCFSLGGASFTYCEESSLCRLFVLSYCLSYVQHVSLNNISSSPMGVEASVLPGLPAIRELLRFFPQLVKSRVSASWCVASKCSIPSYHCFYITLVD